MSKILIVDDEKDIADLISYNLEREGFSTIKVFHGDKVLAIIKAQKPDLMILDLMLPGTNGLDICKGVRANPGIAHLPVIMLTAKSDEVAKVS